MEYRMLGSSRLRISRIGFGCMSLSGEDASNIRLLQAAAAQGINFFDTADLYKQGANEMLVGKALKDIRKDVVFATKVGNEWKQDRSGWRWNPTKKYILAAVDKSLQRLQTDYIDLYQLHGGTIDDDIDDTLEAFTLLQQQGKIRQYGISSIRPNVIRSYAARSALVSVMMQYSLLDRRPAEACLDLLRDKDIAVLARGSLAGGLLINKPAKQYLQYQEAEVQGAAAAVARLAINGRTKTATALQFALQQPGITSVVTGVRTMDQLTQALTAMDTRTLTVDEITGLRESIALNYYTEHR